MKEKKTPASPVTEDVTGFPLLKRLVRERFNAMTGPRSMAMVVEYDRDEIWERYIGAFPEESRQGNVCNSCRSFIRQAGGVVEIDPATLELRSVWRLDGVPEEYRAAVESIRDYVEGLPVKGPFRGISGIGTDRNYDEKRGVYWNHFRVEVPRQYQGDDASTAEIRDTHAVLLRSVTEISRSAVDTVGDLISQNVLYRGREYSAQVSFLKSCMDACEGLPVDKVGRRLWILSQTVSAAVARVRNTAIGTLLVDLSEGRGLEASVSAFERIVAPSNYRRPTSLVTPRMVEDARRVMSEAGYVRSLERRKLDPRDIPVHRALFVFRGDKPFVDPFDAVSKDAQVDPRKLGKVDSVPVADFVSSILPQAKSIRALLERSHFGNFVTLTGPADPESPSMFKWPNALGWSYTGGVADSIKEKVKSAGGKVDGWMRASLAWHNHDDLDLHLRRIPVRGTDDHVYYANTRSSRLGAHLDVDMNAGVATTRTPVENIHVQGRLPEGTYEVSVNQFSRRESTDVGYEVELEIAGETHTFSSSRSPAQSATVKVATVQVMKDGTVSVNGEASLSRSGSAATKWGLRSGSWQNVRSVVVSPNHWGDGDGTGDRGVGNKHMFFILEGCVSDEKTRAFYNEFLDAELVKKHGKVLEVLADRVEVAPADGPELSGLGFSDTLRNHLYVEVETTFKRVVRVEF